MFLDLQNSVQGKKCTGERVCVPVVMFVSVCVCVLSDFL